MEYDWFWVILAVGVFAAVAIVPLELALDAYWRWRNLAGRSANVRSREATMSDRYRLHRDEHSESSLGSLSPACHAGPRRGCRHQARTA
jgi:hypothetical protein